MSKRQTSKLYEEDDFSSENEDDCFFFDDDSSVCSDEENMEEDTKIAENIEQRREEEKKQKDLQQTIGLQLLNIRNTRDWKVPETNTSSNNEEFPSLLSRFQPFSQKTKESPIKSKKGAGFTNTVPSVVFGPTDISVRLATCVFFLQGKCTKPNCAYYHPKNKKCKFDTACTNKKCVFVHSSSENNTASVQSTKPQQSKPQNNEKRKHKICLNTFQFVGNKLSTTQKPCKHGDNCMYAHSTKEVANAIQSNKEKFKCNFGQKCKHVILEIIREEPKKVFKYQNLTEFCECPRVHTRESVQDYIVRVYNSRRPPPLKVNANSAAFAQNNA